MNCCKSCCHSHKNERCRSQSVELQDDQHMNSKHLRESSEKADGVKVQSSHRLAKAEMQPGASDQKVQVSPVLKNGSLRGYRKVRKVAKSFCKMVSCCNTKVCSRSFKDLLAARATWQSAWVDSKSRWRESSSSLSCAQS